MSDDDITAPPRNKSCSFSMQERKLLLKIINKYYDIVNNKKIDTKSTNEKNQAWDSIHDEFCASSVVQYRRSAQQLKRCWENLRSKAKKGEVGAQNLLQWAKNKYLRTRTDCNKELGCHPVDGTGGTLPEQQSEGSISDSDELPTNSQQDFNEFLESSLQQLSSEQDCQHCECDKLERIMKMRLMKFEKQQMERIYNTKLQSLREKAKRDKELHRLAVHDMTLRVENERRRAEILEKELSLQTY